ncbi:MAG TPA: saccharopine dehydrogenase NADP-binding domain-containing protein [Streptosporangiaceae bacterium]
MHQDRELDLVLLGATGFVGRLTAAYLAGNAPPGLRIGLAGRSEQRLTQTREGLGEAARSWPLIVADPTSQAGAELLAGKTGAIATTVGPYRRLGLALAQACATAGTDYADLTGEVLFIRDTMAACHEQARRTGARLVHSCGFDSVPSDLGTLLTHQAAAADGAGDLEDTTLVVTGMRGGISGGTLASGLGQFDDMRASASNRRIVRDPYALSPDREAEPALGDERELAGVRHDADLNLWIGPFLMAGFNTRIVRRSNALLDWAYGRRFRYREVTGFGAGPAAPAKALAATAAFAAVLGGVALRPSRALLGPLLPKPGQGPSEKARHNGYFRIQVHARTSAGARYVTKVEAPGDPGYAATAVMLGESALCLAADRDRLPDLAGVLTPATAMGSVLADRLRAAGHTYTTAPAGTRSP